MTHRRRRGPRVRRRRQRRRHARRTERSRHRRGGALRGRAFHSSNWDHSKSTAGERVASIGTGASAIQYVPGHRRRGRAPDRLPAHADLGVAAVRRAVHRRAAGAVRARSRWRRAGSAKRPSNSTRWPTSPRTASRPAGATDLARELPAPQDRRPGAAGQTDTRPTRWVASVRCCRGLGSRRSPVPNVTLETSPIVEFTERWPAHRRRRRARRGHRHLRNRIQGRRLPWQPGRVRPRRRPAARRLARRCRGVPRHRRPRLPESVHPLRPEHQRGHVDHLHPRGPGAVRRRLLDEMGERGWQRSRSDASVHDALQRRDPVGDGGHRVDGQLQQLLSATPTARSSPSSPTAERPSPERLATSSSDDYHWRPGRDRRKSARDRCAAR